MTKDNKRQLGKALMTKANPKTRPKRRPAKAAAPAQMTPEKKDNVICAPPLPDELNKTVPHLKHLGGGKSDKWNRFLAEQTLNSAWYYQDIAPEARAEQTAAILGFLAGVNPRDTIEGMMAAQLFASHASAMECYRRAMLPGQSIEAKEMLLTLAAKLTKANAAQVEALKKHRSNGQQRMTVEHVHVHAGGQAVVGVVEAPGGGDQAKSKDQPHALGYAPGEEMRSTHEERDTLPVPRDGKR